MPAIATSASPPDPWPRQAPAARPAPRDAAEDRPRRTVTPVGQGRLARWSMAVLFLLFAYEWLISGLNKVLSADFRPGLAANLREAMKDNPNHWYVHWLNRTIIPHAAGVALLIEIGELLVAGGFVLGAVLWLHGHWRSLRVHQLCHLIVLVTLLGSAFLTANYYFLMGKTWPWLKTSDPFDEGLSIDGLLTLVSLALFFLQLLTWPRPPAAIAPASAE